jgi:hypothetical protein
MKLLTAALLLCTLLRGAAGALNTLTPAACVTPGALTAIDYFPSKLEFAVSAQARRARACAGVARPQRRGAAAGGG